MKIYNPPKPTGGSLPKSHNKKEVMLKSKIKMLEILKDYFEERNDVAFAFLFGSAARGKIRREGDIDIAVYF